MALKGVFGTSFKAESALGTGAADFALNNRAVEANRADDWGRSALVLALIATWALITPVCSPLKLKVAWCTGLGIDGAKVTCERAWHRRPRVGGLGRTVGTDRAEVCANDRVGASQAVGPRGTRVRGACQALDSLSSVDTIKAEKPTGAELGLVACVHHTGVEGDQISVPT